MREEVKYVHTDTDLMIMEKAARGKKDIVLGYVLSLGTQGMEKNDRMDVKRQDMLRKEWVKVVVYGVNDGDYLADVINYWLIDW